MDWEAASLFDPFVMILIALIITVVLWDVWRKKKRKSSLRCENGVYMWVEFDGTVKTSETHPEAPGGDWYGDGDGDGGDGGGGD